VARLKAMSTPARPRRVVRRIGLLASALAAAGVAWAALTVESDLRSRYDARGQLAATTLPDGSELVYERNGEGQVTALSRRGAGGAPRGWGSERLAFDLQRDVAGLRQIRFGNGVLGRWHRSRGGILTRIVYTDENRAPPRALWDSRLLSDSASGSRVARRADGMTEHRLVDAERHRVADLDAKGRITRQYVWLAGQLIAVIDLDRPRMPHAPPRTVTERIGRAIAAAWRLLAGPGERIAYVHVDHLGAPVLMTDSHARPVWSAEAVDIDVTGLGPGATEVPTPPPWPTHPSPRSPR
jgi:YD repeat-containing protein